MKAYIETYGCTLNKGDSLIMMKLLTEQGHTIVEREEDADAVILNTCVVRLETEERMKQRIRYFSKTGKRLIVAGCMASSQPGTISKLAPQASIIGPQSVSRISSLLESNEVQVILEPDDPSRYSIFNSGTIAVIPIQDGCASSCNFCITKLSRNYLRSFPVRRIKEWVMDAVKKGAKEIELTGQDLATYGLDLKSGVSLVDVLEEVTDIDGDFYIRIGMMNPEYAFRIIDRLLEVMKREKIFKFLHIPVQSGDDKVLQLMNRKYTVDEYISLVNKIRKELGETTIATDIIVGHPGEDDESFENTLLLMEKLRFDKIHLAMYSPRHNTRSMRMPQIPEKVKKERTRRANELYERIAGEIFGSYVGKVVDVITTEVGKDKSVIGRTISYKPVVVYEFNKLGEKIQVRITDHSFFDLRGLPSN